MSVVRGFQKLKTSSVYGIFFTPFIDFEGKQAFGLPQGGRPRMIMNFSIAKRIMKSYE